MSSIESSVSTPSLQTLKRPEEHSSSSLRNAASLPRSERVEIRVARKTDIPIPTVSTISPPRKTKKRFIIRAPRSILMTGSPRFSKKVLRNPLLFFFSSIFEPFFFLDASASAELRPSLLFSVEPIISSPLQIPYHISHIYDKLLPRMTSKSAFGNTEGALNFISVYQKGIFLLLSSPPSCLSLSSSFSLRS